VTNEDLGFTDLVLIGTHEVVGKNGFATGDVVSLPDPLCCIRALLGNQIISVLYKKKIKNKLDLEIKTKREKNK